MSDSISDYALIGDGRTAALVDRDGAIEWLCWPRFDSDACLAAMLGGSRFGHWTLRPSSQFTTHRRYLGATPILETTFETATGSVKLLDFLCAASAQQFLVRIVTGSGGTVVLNHIFAPRMENGKRIPTLRREDSSIVAKCEQLSLHLCTSRSILPEEDVSIREREQVAFILSAQAIKAEDIGKMAKQCLEAELRFWNSWCKRCTYDGPWRDMVLRSLITLKALIYAPTGGMIAAPTSSLPETIGGVRNWDYRYCWLRDSTFAVLALLHAGYRDEAIAWINWLHAAVSPDMTRTQPVYGVGGEQQLIETEADWLPGFLGSRPVRFGNDAYRQYQLDVYGEVQDTLHQWRRLTGTRIERSWSIQCGMLRRMEALWPQPDSGIWEQRGHLECFTQSRCMGWVAVDRMIKSAERFGFDGPIASWNKLRTQLHAEVCQRGFDCRLNAFTRSYGSQSLDASTLLLPIVGFLPPSDPRIVGTISAITRHLAEDGFVYRYDQSRENDGIRQREGTFLPCSFWLADNLILQKRIDKAAAFFEKLLGAANDVGLMPEQYDPSNKVQLGNTPQALTHLSLVHTALNLQGLGPAHVRGTT